MSTPRRQVENRDTYRCTVPEGQRDAVLLVGQRRIRVQLENESSSGFAAWCEQDPRLARGDEACLQAEVGQFVVRVAHVTEIERDSSEDAPGDDKLPEATGSRYYIGLRLVRELETQFQPPPGTGRCPGTRLLVSSEFTFGVLITLVIALVLAGTTVTTAAWMEHPWAAGLLGFSESTVKELSPSQIRLQAVARAIGLTDTQRDQLSEVAENVATTLQYLDEQWRNDRPQERARKQQLFAEAVRREIMSFLSEEQQHRWQATFGF